MPSDMSPTLSPADRWSEGHVQVPHEQHADSQVVSTGSGGALENLFW